MAAAKAAAAAEEDAAIQVRLLTGLAPSVKTRDPPFKALTKRCARRVVAAGRRLFATSRA